MVSTNRVRSWAKTRSSSKMVRTFLRAQTKASKSFFKKSRLGLSLNEPSRLDYISIYFKKKKKKVEVDALGSVLLLLNHFFFKLGLWVRAGEPYELAQAIGDLGLRAWLPPLVKREFFSHIVNFIEMQLIKHEKSAICNWKSKKINLNMSKTYIKKKSGNVQFLAKSRKN